MRGRLLVTTVLVASLLAGFGSAAEAGWEEGVKAFQAGNYNQAIKEFQQVVAERPEWAGGYLMLGQALSKADRKSEALTQFRKAYELDSKDPRHGLALAQAHMDAGNHKEAAAVLKKVDSSSLPKAQKQAYDQMLGVALAKSGNAAEALTAMKRAAEAKGTDPDAWYAYGTMAFNAGDIPAAANAIGKAVQLDSKDTGKKETYIKVLIRQARESQGAAKRQAYGKAVEAAQALAAQAPTYDNLLTLGEVHLGAESYRAAADAFTKAAAKNPNDWLSNYYLGQTFTVEGQYAQAETALQKALAKAGADADKKRIWKQIGFVKEKTRDYEAAKAAYRNAGDSGAVARVEQNQRIQGENAEIEAENDRIRQMEEERRRLEEELKELPGGRPPYY
jgi:tetratricopeptide (TPR) repeat protein